MASPLGSAPGIMFGVGVGTAAAAALEPLVEPGKQAAWHAHANKVLDAGLVARLVAAGAVDLGVGADVARRTGFGADPFRHLVWLAQRVPEWAQVRDLVNRQIITAAQGNEALDRHAYPKTWRDRLVQLYAEILSPGELAAAIHRGLIPDPGLLRGQQPEPPFKVEAYPVYQINALDEAQGSGYDHDRLGVLVGLQGLPMGTHEAAQAFYKGIIEHGDYIRAFNESNSRNEWAQAVLDNTRQIPTARDYIENALRGYRTFKEAAIGAARHGMIESDARIIFQNSGRPLNLHQISQAIAWGAKYNPQPGDDPDPYMNSVLIGSVTPAYYEMQDTLKWNLPSAFFFRLLQQQNVLTESEAVTWYKRLGWPPELATQVAKSFATPANATAKPDPHVAKAQVQLWTTTHKSFVAGEINRTQSRNALGVAGVAAPAITQVLDIWDAEKALIRAQMSAANIKRTFNKGGRNHATGQKWTRDEAIAALVELGWAVQAANDYLDIP